MFLFCVFIFSLSFFHFFIVYLVYDFIIMLQHCYVPDRFGYGLIVPLLKDKHGDQSKSDMYTGITLSPTIAKLFEYLR